MQAIANIANLLAHVDRRHSVAGMPATTAPDAHAAPRQIVRSCDVAVLGGSAAGLGAALQLAQQRRSVIVVDDGSPRNAPARPLPGSLGHDGVAPGRFVDDARRDVRRYGVEVLAGRVVDVHRAHEPSDGPGGSNEDLRVELTGGHTLLTRRLVVATGIVDEFPDVDGLAEHWGGVVAHCPFCHGYDARDRRIVQILTHPVALHATPMLRQLTPDLTVVVHGCQPAPDDLDALRSAGVDVRVTTVESVRSAPDGPASLTLADGTDVTADVVFVAPRFRPRIEALTSIGLTTEAHPSGLGDVVTVGPTGETPIPGVYAAGNVTDPSQQLLHAAADGSRVGAMVCHDLATEDLRRPVAATAGQRDWDRRYDGDAIWSGNPNGALVRETAHLTPGRALDVGAGEGGDAIWLAEQGWSVCAADISQRALDRVATVASQRGLVVDRRRADANDLAPFDTDAFDLVTAHYASIPRTPDGRAVRNLLDAVAPGGTLLVVNHDPAPMRTAVDTSRHSRPFDVDAYVSTDDVVAALADLPEWTVEVHATVPRRAGAVSSAHHVDDVVLRARRDR
jgi:thioredoxin reductase/SAM-dependent methyltransferase